MKAGSATVSPIIRKISVLPLAAVIFFTVSGGPYGLEPLIGYAGTWAIPLLMITPLLWDIPMILAVLELNSMMPVEGGYYEWVKRGLGIRWAFMEGWWTWLYSFVDLAIYPVLFVEYASFFFPELANYKTPIYLAVIWGIAALNIRGIRARGQDGPVAYRSCNDSVFDFIFYRFFSSGLSSTSRTWRTPFFKYGAFYHHVELSGLGQCNHICRRSQSTSAFLPEGHHDCFFRCLPLLYFIYLARDSLRHTPFPVF